MNSVVKSERVYASRKKRRKQLEMRSWRNWQTRKTKDLVANTMQVQFLSIAPSLNSLNFFVIKRTFGLFCFMSEFETFNGF